MKAKTLLDGRGSLRLGTVHGPEHDAHKLGLRHSPYIGCVTVTLDGKNVSGRFPDDRDVEEILAHVYEFCLVPGCTFEPWGHQYQNIAFRSLATA
jgi:hypothetical protein